MLRVPSPEVLEDAADVLVSDVDEEVLLEAEAPLAVPAAQQTVLVNVEL